jgi:hypothetical protein
MHDTGIRPALEVRGEPRCGTEPICYEIDDGGSDRTGKRPGATVGG